MEYSWGMLFCSGQALCIVLKEYFLREYLVGDPDARHGKSWSRIVATVPSAAFLVAVSLKTAASRHGCSGPSTPPKNARATSPALPVRYASVDTATQRFTARQGDT